MIRRARGAKPLDFSPSDRGFQLFQKPLASRLPGVENPAFGHEGIGGDALKPGGELVVGDYSAKPGAGTSVAVLLLFPRFVMGNKSGLGAVMPPPPSPSPFPRATLPQPRSPLYDLLGGTRKPAYVAFDLLWLGGGWCRSPGLPLSERRRRLKAIHFGGTRG